MVMNSNGRVLGYLSAAPRVSTQIDTELSGARSHVLGVIDAFRELNWEVKEFIVGNRVPKSWHSEGSEGIMRGGGFRTFTADIMRLGMGIILPYIAWRELNIQVDWVYERNASLQSLGGIFKRHGIPWILETNAPLFFEAKEERKSIYLSSLARVLELKAYRDCDVLVCVTQTLKDFLVQEADLEADKIVVVPNGVDVNFFDPDLYRPKRVFKEFTIGFVGSLYHWQRLDLLLDVIQELKQDGVCINLTIVGDGAAKLALEQISMSMSLENQVAFIGRVPRKEVPNYIAGFDIGYSGQGRLSIGTMYLSPLKLYEYMAMAKPVIASSHEDARKLIFEKQTGYLFQTDDPYSLKENVLKALANRSQLPDLGLRAREEIVKHHSWTSRVSELIQHVNHILSPSTN